MSYTVGVLYNCKMLDKKIVCICALSVSCMCVSVWVHVLRSTHVFPRLANIITGFTWHDNSMHVSVSVCIYAFTFDHCNYRGVQMCICVCVFRCLSVLVCCCLWWRDTLSLADAVSHQLHLISSSVYVCAYLHMQIDIDVSVLWSKVARIKCCAFLSKLLVCVCVFTWLPAAWFCLLCLLSIQLIYQSVGHPFLHCVRPCPCQYYWGCCHCAASLTLTLLSVLPKVLRFLHPAELVLHTLTLFVSICIVTFGHSCTV